MMRNAHQNSIAWGLNPTLLKKSTVSKRTRSASLVPAYNTQLNKKISLGVM
jgi:hypothetical protein